MKTLNLLGFDFGASSERAMLGTLTDGKLELREIHRFSNDPVTLCGRFVWDVPRMFYEMKQALLKISHMDVKVDAIGIDTWGVDYGLLAWRCGLIDRWESLSTRELAADFDWRRVRREDIVMKLPQR